MRSLCVNTLSRSLTQIEKYAFDNTIIRDRVLKRIPSRLSEAKSNLSTWDEL